MKTKLIKGFGTLALASMILTGCGESGGGKDKGCQHEYGDWFADILPTETETGVASRMCDLCENIEEVDLPVLTDSAYTFGADSATCAGTGIKKANYSFEDGTSIEFGVQTPAKGHDYVEHAAVEPTVEAPIGYEMYYSCSRCTSLFNSTKQAIQSMDEIKVSYYESNETQHWHGSGAKEDHTFGDYTIDAEATITTSGSKSRTCSTCGYKATEVINPIDIGVLSEDGVYNASSIENRKTDADNKLTEGLYITASSAKKLTFDSNGNIVTGGKSNTTGRFLVIKTGGAAKLTIKGSSGKAGTTCEFGFMKSMPTDEGFEFEGDTYTSNTSSTADYDFNIPAAGIYYIGASTTWKIKSITIEIHEIAEGWVKDAQKHWHGSADPACNIRSDEAEHTYGAWTVKTPATATTKGVESHKCTVCNYEETRELDNHNYATEWSKDAKQHWHACTDAGYENLKKDDMDHTFGKATISGNKMNYTCSVCNYTKVVTTTMYVPSIPEEGTTPVFTSTNPFIVGEDATSMTSKGMTLVTDDPETPVITHEFTTMTGAAQTFTTAAKYTGGMLSSSSNLTMHFPAACKITIYASNLGKDGNLRISSAADGYSTNTNVNGDVRFEIGAFNAYEWDIEEAGDYRIGCSSKDMGSKGVYVYAIEIAY